MMDWAEGDGVPGSSEQAAPATSRTPRAEKYSGKPSKPARRMGRVDSAAAGTANVDVNRSGYSLRIGIEFEAPTVSTSGIPFRASTIRVRNRLATTGFRKERSGRATRACVISLTSDPVGTGENVDQAAGWEAAAGQQHQGKGRPGRRRAGSPWRRRRPDVAGAARALLNARQQVAARRPWIPRKGPGWPSLRPPRSRARAGRRGSTEKVAPVSTKVLAKSAGRARSGSGQSGAEGAPQQESSSASVIRWRRICQRLHPRAQRIEIFGLAGGGPREHEVRRTFTQPMRSTRRGLLCRRYRLHSADWRLSADPAGQPRRFRSRTSPRNAGSGRSHDHRRCC